MQLIFHVYLLSQTLPTFVNYINIITIKTWVAFEFLWENVKVSLRWYQIYGILNEDRTQNHYSKYLFKLQGKTSHYIEKLRESQTFVLFVTLDFSLE